MFVNNGSDQSTVAVLKKSMDDDKPVKKSIVLKGSPTYIKKIELMLGYMQYLGNVGHSTSFKVCVDGDGAFRLDMKDDAGKPLSNLMKTPELKQYLYDNDGDIKNFNFE